MTPDVLAAHLHAHAASLGARVTKHARNEAVLAQIARTTPARLRVLADMIEELR